jgi:hypothetical protein
MRDSVVDVSRSSGDDGGLFGYVSDSLDLNKTFTNISIEDSVLHGAYSFGGITSDLQGWYVDTVYADNVTILYYDYGLYFNRLSAGLIGSTDSEMINNTYFRGSIDWAPGHYCLSSNFTAGSRTFGRTCKFAGIVGGTTASNFAATQIENSFVDATLPPVIDEFFLTPVPVNGTAEGNILCEPGEICVYSAPITTGPRYSTSNLPGCCGWGNGTNIPVAINFDPDALKCPAGLAYANEQATDVLSDRCTSGNNATGLTNAQLRISSNFATYDTTALWVIDAILGPRFAWVPPGLAIAEEASSGRSSGTRYAVNAAGEVVGIQQGNAFQQLPQQAQDRGTFLSLTGGESFDVKAWATDLWTTVKGWFVQ